MVILSYKRSDLTTVSNIIQTLLIFAQAEISDLSMKWSIRDNIVKIRKKNKEQKKNEKISIK